MSVALNCWYVVATSSELSADKPHASEIAGIPIVLYRTSTKTIAAMSDRCSHRAAPLSLGRIEGDNLRCMYHGICFSAQGACIEVPGQTAIPKAFSQKFYVTVERHGWIWLWYGPQDADEEKLPCVDELDPASWHVRHGDVIYEADQELINDNLCDLSHLAYVHSATLGAVGSDQWAEDRPTIMPIERGVRIDRRLKNAAAPPYLTGRVDASICYDYVLPGVFLLKSVFHTAGRNDVPGGSNQGTKPPLHKAASIQAVTPLSPGRSRYFFSVSVSNEEPEERVDILFQITVAAFMEDKAMIEAQQAMINRTPNAKLAATSADEAAVRFRRLVATNGQHQELETG